MSNLKKELKDFIFIGDWMRSLNARKKIYEKYYHVIEKDFISLD